jgi:hypothetical protein
MDVDTLFKALDNLSPDEFERLRKYIAEREHSLKHGDSDEWEAALNRAIAEFREGLSEDELQQIVAAMNTKNIDTNDLDDITGTGT